MPIGFVSRILHPKRWHNEIEISTTLRYMLAIDKICLKSLLFVVCDSGSFSWIKQEMYLSSYADVWKLKENVTVSILKDCPVKKEKSIGLLWISRFNTTFKDSSIMHLKKPKTSVKSPVLSRMTIEQVNQPGNNVVWNLLY